MLASFSQNICYVIQISHFYSVIVMIQVHLFYDLPQFDCTMSKPNQYRYQYIYFFFIVYNQIFRGKTEHMKFIAPDICNNDIRSHSIILLLSFLQLTHPS
jgi:hypothetical protein